GRTHHSWWSSFALTCICVPSGSRKAGGSGSTLSCVPWTGKPGLSRCQPGCSTSARALAALPAWSCPTRPWPGLPSFSSFYLKSTMTPPEQWLSKLAKLNVYRAKGGQAPHKPLLLLVLFELAEQGQLPSDVLPLTPELAFKFSSYWG